MRPRSRIRSLLLSPSVPSVGGCDPRLPLRAIQRWLGDRMGERIDHAVGVELVPPAEPIEDARAPAEAASAGFGGAIQSVEAQQGATFADMGGGAAVVLRLGVGP
jgi:hypothetical protein